MIDPSALAREFEARFGRTPRIFHAPGRVNLIGEHTDYNDGFVMPVAIDRRTWVAIAPRGGRTLRVRSESYGEEAAIDLDAPSHGPTSGWTDYVRGVAFVLEASGYRLSGADLLIRSDVPIGAGLSSSAAVEIACGAALAASAGHDIDRTRLALMCQRAEHEFAGTRCGLMDQFTACFGRVGHAMMLDTRTLEPDWLALPPGVSVVVCNTMTRHALASDGYNARREDCETGVRVLAGRGLDIRALRDVTLEQLDAHRSALTGRVYRRCRHVITENARVLDAARALKAERLDQFGCLMAASHRSLRDDYEVSCPELDVMVASASGLDGVHGSRMTGGGFGGCTVNLVRADRADAAGTAIADRYSARTGRTPAIHVCAAASGVEEWR